MKYLIKDINKNEKDRLEKMGLYCYDLRESDMGDEVANIEKNVFINKVGNMITNEKIEFEKNPNDFVNYFDFCMKNEQVDKIEDLLVRNKLDIEKILNETKELLKNSEDYKDMEICYILEDTKDMKESFIIAMEGNDIIQINAITKEVSDVADWAYNIDDDIFAMLESDKKISYMSMNMHYGIWQTIEQWYPEDLEHKKGMQKYLKYCKDNKITKDVIEKKTELDKLPDAMKYYKKEKNKER